MKRVFLSVALILGLSSITVPANAFCGFYVARADTKLFNKASKVVVARHGRRTVVTMASDYQGAPSEFALVVPVPTVVHKGQIKVTSNALVDHLDAFSAPRLVEYYDPNPCRSAGGYRVASMTSAEARRRRTASLGVKIEAEYTVGEYDILVLSAKQSGGLVTWLNDSGYKMPAGAKPILASYIKQSMKFFVAKVNLKKQKKLGFKFLRPLQVDYITDRFMLPIRLGTVNARGPQELFVFFLTRHGRVETTNYRTKKIPTNLEVPISTKREFGTFYRALFDKESKADGMRSVYLEYAWNMATCDPCVGLALSPKQLVELGTFWLGKRLAGDVFVTRLHVRYNAETFPEDLKFQETRNRRKFQGRYILRHPYTGEANCAAGNDYRQALQDRSERDAQTLHRLTGWSMRKIRAEMAKPAPSRAE